MLNITVNLTTTTISPLSFDVSPDTTTITMNVEPEGESATSWWQIVVFLASAGVCGCTYTDIPNLLPTTYNNYQNLY